MEGLGYLPTELHEMRPIKDDGGRVLYHLALFSKSEKAKHFWEAGIKILKPSTGLILIRRASCL